MCQKPCPSVQFDVSQDDSDVFKNSSCKMNEIITNMKEIQPGEMEKVSEVESVTISESNIDHFETIVW